MRTFFAYLTLLGLALIPVFDVNFAACPEGPACCKDEDWGNIPASGCPNAAGCYRTFQITAYCGGTCNSPCHCQISVSYSGPSAHLAVTTACAGGAELPLCTPEFCVGGACTGTTFSGSGLVYNGCTSSCGLIKVFIVTNSSCWWRGGPGVCGGSFCPTGSVVAEHWINCSGPECSGQCI